MPNEYFTNRQELSSMANAIRRKTGSEASIEWKSGKGFSDAIDAIWNTKVYGFHIDSFESDPSICVTYLADAIGATPAHMDYTNGVFDYGSWKDAFFMPKPCMLKYDGTVDYYLDSNDYTKKEDGTASDVADDTYGGNAMMEWGRDGKKIWYKIVPDENDDTSASIYIADHQADADFRAWSFINNRGELADHFYTSIYEGSMDSNDKLRSISGKANTELCSGRTASDNVDSAELNNPSTDKLWYVGVYSDRILINILLILIGKSLDTQSVFGIGRAGKTSNISSALSTGTLDDKGLFFGYNDSDHAVKVFGMENWWGNVFKRVAGSVVTDDRIYKYKMTYGIQDGSTCVGYVTSIPSEDYDGYLVGSSVYTPSSASGAGYFIAKQSFTMNCFYPIYESTGSSATYWCDYMYSHQSTSPPNTVRYTIYGGHAGVDTYRNGAFYISEYTNPVATYWYIGEYLSCKPLAQSE